MSLLPSRGRPEIVELPKTGFQIQGGDLVRLNPHGGEMLRMPIADVVSIKMCWRFDWMGVLFLLVGAGIAAVAYYVSESNLLSVLLYIVAVPVVGLALFGAVTHRLVIETVDGAIHVVCADKPDEVESFVIAVRRIVRTGETSPRQASESSARDSGIEDVGER